MPHYNILSPKIQTSHKPKLRDLFKKLPLTFKGLCDRTLPPKKQERSPTLKKTKGT